MELEERGATSTRPTSSCSPPLPARIVSSQMQSSALVTPARRFRTGVIDRGARFTHGMFGGMRYGLSGPRIWDSPSFRLRGWLIRPGLRSEA
jgi:hypothetical protein